MTAYLSTQNLLYLKIGTFSSGPYRTKDKCCIDPNNQQNIYFQTIS